MQRNPQPVLAQSANAQTLSMEKITPTGKHVIPSAEILALENRFRKPLLAKRKKRSIKS